MKVIKVLKSNFEVVTVDALIVLKLLETSLLELLSFFLLVVIDCLIRGRLVVGAFLILVSHALVITALNLQELKEILRDL